MLYRIIDTDNFAGDYPDEHFWFWPMVKEKAQNICDAINAAAGDNSSRYWKVVPYDYKLAPGFEP